MIKIRKVTKDDCELLLEWRNNPKIYKYALNPYAISIAEHLPWFEQQLKSPRCIFYMGIMNEKPCGSVRYQLNESLDEAEVSISVAPEFWGKGIAAEMMAVAEIELKKATKITIIYATVLNDNKASMRLFEKSQFQALQTKFIKKI